MNHGHTAIIDNEEYAKVKNYKWYVAKDKNTYYVQAHIVLNDKKTTIKMHRIIMDAKRNQILDHIDGNGLNNQKINLRFCTNSENLRNAKKRNNTSSKYKGVAWNCVHKYWQANIYVNGKLKSLGIYRDEYKAAKAYDRAAKKYFGEFARPNFR